MAWTHKSEIKFKTNFREGDMSQNPQNFSLSLKFGCHSEKNKAGEMPMKKAIVLPEARAPTPAGTAILIVMRGRERKPRLTLETHFSHVKQLWCFLITNVIYVSSLSRSNFHC